MIELTKEQEAVFLSVFKIFDTEDDNCVSAKELGSVLKALGQNFSENEIMDMINEIDSDGNGNIQFEEFTFAVADRLCNPENEDILRDVFRIFDIDNVGVISSYEIINIMGVLGEKVPDDVVDGWIREGDIDLDGCLSFEEFVSMMTAK